MEWITQTKIQSIVPKHNQHVRTPFFQSKGIETVTSTQISIAKTVNRPIYIPVTGGISIKSIEYESNKFIFNETNPKILQTISSNKNIKHMIQWKQIISKFNTGNFDPNSILESFLLCIDFEHIEHLTELHTVMIIIQYQYYSQTTQKSAVYLTTIVNVFISTKVFDIK